MGFALPKEADVVRVCTEWLTLIGAVVVRTNSGGMKVGDRYVRFNSEDGCADTLVCLPGGRWLSLEFKRPGRDRTKPERRARQEAHRARITAAGGLAIVARSLDELRAELLKAGYDPLGDRPT
jgi:hypothetical protein